MATGKFLAGNGCFPGKFSGFDQIWPKMGKNDQNLIDLTRKNDMYLFQHIVVVIGSNQGQSHKFDEI